jgi:hypothetical protein
MPAYDILSLFTAAAAPSNPGPVHDLGDLKDEFSLVVSVSGATFSLQLNGSLDGVFFYTMGAAVAAATAAAPALILAHARWIRADLVSISGGTITAKLGFAGVQ